jgi:hypothetical protein
MGFEVVGEWDDGYEIESSRKELTR